jgi:hypothetical protein
MVRRLSTSKRKIVGNILNQGSELILPGDKVIINHADKLDEKVKGSLGDFAIGIEGTVQQFYENGCSIYCHVRTKHGQENYAVPYHFLKIVERFKDNAEYARKLERNWKNGQENIKRLKEQYPEK